MGQAMRTSVVKQSNGALTEFGSEDRVELDVPEEAF